MRTASSVTRIAAAATGGVLVALAVPAPAGAAPAQACETRNNNTYAKLLACVTLEGVREHQAAFQRIADQSQDPVYPGSRAAGTEGYAASVDYVSGLLEGAGYDVSFTPVEFDFQFPVVLQQLASMTDSYESGAYTGSGAGDVTGTVIPVDIQLGTEAQRVASSSGCEAADFAGQDYSGPADIALIQRGGCNFSVKAINAEAAGAEAVVIFNQGVNTGTLGDRFPLIVGTLGGDDVVDIPVVGASFADGEKLAASGSAARVFVREPERRTDYNVIAEKTGVNTGNVVMAGAHLDGVPAGPGMNDNGSGSAALLETALMMANTKPQNTIRFAWWAAEEDGLLGSSAYVDGLSPAELERIALYMNYDMVGSPNGFLGVYDANESSFAAPVTVPEGSEAIERVYESFYTSVGQPYDDTQFSGRSDYQAFIEAGIASGGLFTGAEQQKTPQQAAIWGGAAGRQFDPCYHIACDTYGNVDLEFLDVNSDLIAYAMLTFAYSTESVNGVPGTKVPSGGSTVAPRGPEHTFAGPLGGDGPRDHGGETA